MWLFHHCVVAADTAVPVPVASTGAGAGAAAGPSSGRLWANSSSSFRRPHRWSKSRTLQVSRLCGVAADAADPFAVAGAGAGRRKPRAHIPPEHTGGRGGKIIEV